MAKITGILCQIITGDVSGAGTDGRVYLGLGGREFCMSSAADDYERDSWREYVMGHGPVEPNLPAPQIRVLDGDQNDPRVGFRLETAELNRTPVYIRFEPVGSNANWNLSSAIALVYTGAGQFFASFRPPDGFDSLWLGTDYGKMLYLLRDT
jgi:hypothetical protein